MTDSKRMLLPQPLVLSLLSGATQVSVPVKPQPVRTGPNASLWGWKGQLFESDDRLLCKLDVCCPFPIGTEVWVPEAWKVGAWRDNGRMALDYAASPELVHTPWCYPSKPLWTRLTHESALDCFKAGCKRERIASALDRYGDGPEIYWFVWEAGQSPCRWRSAITMPSWAARLRYIIEGVKAGRAWDATYQDALLEGWHPTIGHIELPITSQGLIDTAHDWYKVRWNAAYPDYPWDSNPWRYSYGLRRLE